MVNQRYADLLKEYRSVEMGNAIRSVFDFYVNRCESNLGAIEKCYINQYIADFSLKDCKKDFNPAQTLHFQRRLIDHFFWLLADLRYSPSSVIKLPRNQLQRDFSQNEHNLLHIIYYMNMAAKKCEIKVDDLPKNLPENLSDESSPMEKYRINLYAESKHWK
jgi:hypothetical protein